MPDEVVQQTPEDIATEISLLRETAIDDVKANLY